MPRFHSRFLGLAGRRDRGILITASAGEALALLRHPNAELTPNLLLARNVLRLKTHCGLIGELVYGRLEHNGAMPAR